MVKSMCAEFHVKINIFRKMMAADVITKKFVHSRRAVLKNIMHRH